MRWLLLAIVMALVAPSEALAKQPPEDAVLVKLRDGGAKPAAKKAPAATKAAKRKPARRTAKKSVAKAKPKPTKKSTESEVRPMP